MRVITMWEDELNTPKPVIMRLVLMDRALLYGVCAVNGLNE